MIDQKVAIVTAASRGIGAACAEVLAHDGYKLILMSRSDDLFPLADRLEARPIKGNLSAEADIERVVGFTYEKYGRIDLVVNNTGHAPKGELLSITDSEWIQGLELLFLNVVRISRFVTPLMKKQKGGSFINISTFGAKEPSLDFPVSSVIRSALASFSKLFVQEFAADQIRMNNILPGYIDSYPAAEETINSIPMLRQGTPEEVAALVSFLASEKGAYINGQSILIDGGLTRSI